MNLSVKTRKIVRTVIWLTVESDIEKEYFKWLYSIVITDRILKLNGLEGESFYILLKKLHQIDFYWVVELDENRALDGQNLREEFASLTDFDDYSDLSGACSMLEFMIGLAKRMSFLDCKEGEEDKIDLFFWEQLSNLFGNKIKKRGTDGSITEDFLVFVVEQVNKFLEKSDEKVSIFNFSDNESHFFEPSKNAIWDQMQQFLMKKC